MTVQARLTCDRCGKQWWAGDEDEAGTIGLALIPPGLMDPNHARQMHLCSGCTAGLEGFLASGITIAPAGARVVEP